MSIRVFLFFSHSCSKTIDWDIKREMADYNQTKNERLRGRKYKYKENYITEVNTVHGVSEYEPKEETFELFEKENKFNESKQTVQNENENLIETNRRERTLVL